MKTRHMGMAAMVAAAAAAVASAEQIVQTGSLHGGLGSMNHVILVDQFNDMGGSLVLNFVQIDLLTSLIGGGTSNSSGVPTHILAQLEANYFLDGELLAETQAVIDLTIPNSNEQSFTAFNTDTEQVVILDALAPWIGAGSLTLDAVTNFILTEDPKGSVGFNAGGTVNYTVTYDFSVIPGAPTCVFAPLLTVHLLRRRRG